MPKLLQLIPEYHARVWGGRRLPPGGASRTEAGSQPIGEAWLVYESNRVAAGEWAGRTLAELSAALGAELLGEAALRRTGTRFPLLIKLLDCADWLSIQVHPNDEQAIRRHGPGSFGKTEAWHILAADPGARLIAGVRPGATPGELASAIRTGAILDWVQYHSVRAGDTLYVPAGTVHALGPGLFLYEIQQTSDLTYRVFDWNRPASAGRALHIEESVMAANAALAGERRPAPRLGPNDTQRLVACDYFTLDLVAGAGEPSQAGTRGEGCHALTVIDGRVEVACGDECLALQPFETVLIPAAAGAYQLRPLGSFRLLRGSPAP
ncbi:MAG: class I mannose-6-phosphate isomerase [Anaerolineales bacterium]|nr:class I mannose-6-phosphate isomerase [Anaerolineales bacterium]